MTLKEVKKILLNGIWKENAVLVLLIGMCPAFAVTTRAQNALGMGAATLFVLFFSNLLVSALRRVIPGSVRLPCYIVLISGFATIVGLLLKRCFPAIDQQLGMYVSLIVVNCIIMMRAEAFAGKSTVGRAMVDGIGTGIGFTFALLLIGSVREIVGQGTWFDLKAAPAFVEPMAIFVDPAGAFFTLAIIVAVINKLSARPAKVKHCAECGQCSHTHEKGGDGQ